MMIPGLVLLDGVFKDPGEWTCSSGSQRCIDYLVVSADIAPGIEVEVDRASPWTPHRGLAVRILGLASPVLVRKLVAPRSLLAEHVGPTRPWTEWWSRAEVECSRDPGGGSDLWVRLGSSDVELDWWYRVWSQAVSLQALSRCGVEKQSP